MIKAVFDRVSAALALMVVAPLFVVIALAIRMSNHGPVFFRQIRIGKDGEPFTVWRFRTMVVDAESRKAELLARNEGDGTLFKMRRDPSSRASPACGRSVGVQICPGTRRRGWTCGTSRTGLSPWTCRFSGKRYRRS